MIADAPQVQFRGCFTDPGCATLAVGGPFSDAEDCCVNNNAGLYYNQGGQCFQCIGKCYCMYQHLACYEVSYCQANCLAS